MVQKDHPDIKWFNEYSENARQSLINNKEAYPKDSMPLIILPLPGMNRSMPVWISGI